MDKQILSDNRFLNYFNFKDVILLAKQLIEIPSHELYPNKEKDIAFFIYDLLNNKGINVELQEVTEGRMNIIACIKGNGNGKSLMFNGHLDTVPPYDMDSALTPYISDGKLYGRGSVDMLGAIAGMIYTLLFIKEQEISLTGDLIFTGVIGEESGSVGAWHLVKHNSLNVDYAIIGEPTMMKIATAHKGVEWFEIIFKGISTHGSTPDKGINAIYHATTFIENLKKEMSILANKLHPLLGCSTINIGEIHGGKRPTIVPDYCSVRLERRFLPEENSDSVYNELRSILIKMKEENREVDAEIKKMTITRDVPHPPFETPDSSPLIDYLSNAYELLEGKRNETIGVNFWSDAAIFSNFSRMDCAICGPGSIIQAHSNNEYIELSQLELGAKVYLKTALSICE